MRFYFLLSLLVLLTHGFAQNKSCDKAIKSYELKNYKAADKLADKCLQDPSSAKNPNLLLLKSKVQFAIYQDKSLSEKFPNAIKDAMKFAEKAIDANTSESMREAFKLANSDYLRQLIQVNNQEALFSYNGGKYSKALPFFKRSIGFGLDTMSMIYAADCYWQLEQWEESVNLYKKTAEIIYAAVLDSNLAVAGYQRMPFRRLCEYYIRNEHLDSAYIYVKNGREILPNDPELTNYTYKLMRYHLDKVPPSYDYLSMVKSGLKDFPFDSFLNHRENSIYIYLLNGMATAGAQNQFDSLFKIYADAKYEKRHLKRIELVKKFDIFAGMDNPAFTEAIMKYFADSRLDEASYSTIMYYSKSMSSGTSASADLSKIFPTLPRTDLVEIAYRFQLKKNPKNQALIKSLSDYTAALNKKDLAYYDLLPSIRLNDQCKLYFPKNTDFPNKSKQYRLRLISESADTGDFALARKIWFEASNMYPDQIKALDEKWRKIVENDFRMNYFGSRINPKGKSERGVPEYAWNGNADSCKWGSMSDEIVLRAQQRVNYFRRMAGMSEMVSFAQQDNEMCMFAVMMCEANRTMTHEANDGWRCFVPAGADALKTAILSKDGNPAIAVTAAMGQNHPTVGNRRWLLYPNALYMGIGTSKTYTAIKAIDNTRDLDTNKYKSQFIAWPPANACPKMLVFKKWSFSIDLDLTGAQVSMSTSGGQAVELRQETYSTGYGLNTLVWEPNLAATPPTDAAVYHVSIKLKTGKTIAYSVKIIDVKL